MSGGEERPVIVGIAGGSGSGKTTFAERLRANLGADRCVIISQDNYYHDQSHRFDGDGGSVNFDHPKALDFELLGRHLHSLARQQPVEIPLYDFASHSRLEETLSVVPKPLILVEGILIFTSEHVVAHLHHRIFIDCPEPLRFRRRLERDVTERGRSPAGVKAQFHAQVKPMHDRFVEPSRAHAHDVVGVEDFDQRLAHWTERLSEYSGKKKDDSY